MTDKAFELVSWHHQDADQPCFIVAELDSDRWEVRKIEAFASGAIQRVSLENPEYGTTVMADQPWPELADIESEPSGAFSGRSLTSIEFESLWQRGTLDQLEVLLREGSA